MRDFGRNRDDQRGGNGGAPQRHFRRPQAQAGRMVEREGAEPVFLDPELRAVATLRHDKNRERESRYLVEGVRAVETLLERVKDNVVSIYETEGVEWRRSLAAGLRRVPVRKVSEAEMAEISVTKTAQGLIAVAESRAIRINWDLARRITLVDGAQDPGNLGAMFRSAAAFGFDGMVLGKGTVDAWNPRVVRGSSGLVATVPFEQDVRLEAHFDFLRSKGFTIVGTSPHGKDRLDQLPANARVALLVGNEARGAAPGLLNTCDMQVRIPIAPGVESLNVGVAHGILCSQLSLIS